MEKDGKFMEKEGKQMEYKGYTNNLPNLSKHMVYQSSPQPMKTEGISMISSTYENRGIPTISLTFIKHF